MKNNCAPSDDNPASQPHRTAPRAAPSRSSNQIRQHNLPTSPVLRHSDQTPAGQVMAREQDQAGQRTRRAARAGAPSKSRGARRAGKADDAGRPRLPPSRKCAEPYARRRWSSSSTEYKPKEQNAISGDADGDDGCRSQEQPTHRHLIQPHSGPAQQQRNTRSTAINRRQAVIPCRQRHPRQAKSRKRGRCGLLAAL